VRRVHNVDGLQTRVWNTVEDDVRYGRGRSARRHAFYFVTDGFHAALSQARAAAGNGNVIVAGGASTVRQAFTAQVINELVLARPSPVPGDASVTTGMPSLVVSVLTHAGVHAHVPT